jgi:hypothetical protein
MKKGMLPLISELCTAEYIHYQILALVKDKCTFPAFSDSKTWKVLNFECRYSASNTAFKLCLQHVQVEIIREMQQSAFSERWGTYKMMHCSQEGMCCLEISWDRIGQQQNMWWSNAHIPTTHFLDRSLAPGITCSLQHFVELMHLWKLVHVCIWHEISIEQGSRTDWIAHAASLI